MIFLIYFLLVFTFIFVSLNYTHFVFTHSFIGPYITHYNSSSLVIFLLDIRSRISLFMFENVIQNQLFRLDKKKYIETAVIQNQLLRLVFKRKFDFDFEYNVSVRLMPDFGFLIR